MISLTHQQARLLDFIKGYQEFHKGISPSFDEMRAEMGLASKSGIHQLVNRLIERGAIRKIPDRARAIEVLSDRPLADISSSALIAELALRADGASILRKIAAVAS